MTTTWHTTPLGEILTRKRDVVDVQEAESYTRLTIRLNGKGICIRDTVTGTEIGTKRQFIARKGQLVLSKIDARNGAFGVLPDECDKAIITGNFWAFEPNPVLLDVRYLTYLTKTPLFVDFCIRASEGSTNRRYLQEPKFLTQQIPLPPLPEQRRIVGRIDELSAKIEEAKELRNKIKAEITPLIQSFIASLCFNNKHTSCIFGDILLEAKNGIYKPPFFWGHGIPCIRMYNIDGPTLNVNNLQYLEVTEEEFKTYGCVPGDLIFNRVNSAELVGKTGLIREDYPKCTFESKNMRLRINPQKAIPEYAVIVLNSTMVKDYYRAVLKQQCGMATLNQNHVRNIPFPLPSLEEQRQIVKYLDDLQSKIDSLKSLQAETEKELNALLPSILDKAFKGEL